jgi:integrase
MRGAALWAEQLWRVVTQAAEACQTLKPRWVAFLMVCFGGGLRWGETTALSCQDIDWHRERVHGARTWSEGSGRIERCKDGEDRWVKLPPAVMACECRTRLMLAGGSPC